MILEDDRLYQGQPGTTASAIYTVGTGNSHTKVHKFQVIMANTSAAAATVTLSLVPSGQVAGVGNRILPAVEIPANSTGQMTFNQYMELGDFLSAVQGTSGAITLTISGVVE